MDKAGTRADTRRRRRPWRLITSGLIVLTLLAAILFGPWLLMNIAPVRGWVLNSALLRQALGEDVRLTIEHVDRLDVAGITLRDVELRVRDPEDRWHSVVRAGRLAATWSFPRLLAQELQVHEFEVTPLTLSLDGIALVQRGREKREASASSEAGPLPDWLRKILIQQLRLGPFEVSNAQGLVVGGELARAELEIAGQDVLFLLEEAWANVVPLGLEASLSEGRFFWREGKGSLRGLLLKGSRVEGILHARYDTQGSGEGLRVEALLDRLDPALLAERFLPDLELLPGDSLSGSVDLRRGADQTHLDLVLAGALLGEELEELSARLTLGAGSLWVDDFLIRGQVGEVSGQGRWESSPREASANLAWQQVDHRSAWLPWLQVLPVGERLAGSATATLVLAEDSAPSLAGEVQVRGATLWGIPTRRIHLRGQVDWGHALHADQLQVLFPAGELQATGDWPLGDQEVRASVQLDSVTLAILPAEWRWGTEGRVSGEVQVSGPPTDPVLEGTLRATDLSRGSWHTEALSAGSLLLWPRSLLGSATLHLSGLRHGSGTPCQLTARFSRWNRWLSLVADLHLASGEVNAEGRLDPQGWLEMERASVRLPRLGQWQLERPFRFSWVNDTLRADSLCLTGGGARLWALGEWMPSVGEVDAHLGLEAFDAVALRELLGSEQQLGGRCGLRLDLRGQLPDPWALLAFEGDSLTWGGVDLGQVDVTAEWSDSSLSISPVVLESEQQSVRLSSFSYQAGRPLLGLWAGAADSAASRDDPPTALGDAPWFGALTIDRLDLAQWAPLLGMRAQEGGSAARDTIRVQHRVGGRWVPIEVVAPWHMGPAAAGAGGVGGTFGASLSLSGTPRHPVVELHGTSGDFNLARLPLGTLSLDLGYADSLITLERLELSDQDRVSTATGFYPFALQLMPLRAEPLARPVNLEGELEDLNLALASGFTRWLPDAQGRVSGSLAIAGTGIHPELSGNLRLREGGVRIPGRSEKIYAASAEIVLTPQAVRLESLEARSGPRGVLTAQGTATGPNDFDLIAHANEVRIFEEGSYDFLVTADTLHVFSQIPEGGSQPVPHLQGNVSLLTGTYAPDFARAASSAGSQREVPWLIDLGLSLAGDVRVNQPNAKVDVGDGMLRLAYRWPYWNASGSLRILGGTYRLLNNNFSITEGTLDFLDTGTGADVTVAVDGETYVTTPVAGEERTETYTVAVQVQGKPDELQVTLSSVPPLSTEEILELLSYGRYTAATTDAATPRQYLFNTETQGILFSRLVAEVENSLAEQIPLVSRVALAPGASGDEAWRLSLQQVFTPTFTGHYSREFFGGEDWELSLDYRLSRIFYLRAGRKHELVGSRGEDQYSLDLKCRFEYE